MKVDKREKTGGRSKGTPNKLNAEAKMLFVETLGKHSENIDEALETVFKEDKVKFLELFAKYAMYFTPKMTENKIDANVETVHNILNLGTGIDPNETTK